MGTHRKQLKRHYGMFFAAVRAVVEEKPKGEMTGDDSFQLACAECGCELPPLSVAKGWSHHYTDALARTARDRWRKVLTIKRPLSEFARKKLSPQLI